MTSLFSGLVLGIFELLRNGHRGSLRFMVSDRLTQHMPCWFNYAGSVKCSQVDWADHDERRLGPDVHLWSRDPLACPAGSREILLTGLWARVSWIYSVNVSDFWQRKVALFNNPVLNWAYMCLLDEEQYW